MVLSVSGPTGSGLRGGFSDSSLSGSESTSTLTIKAIDTARLGSHTITVTGTSGSLTRTDMAEVVVKDPNRQPTSLSLAATEGYAGNDCVTITVGDGANMDVVLKYKRDGAWQNQLSLSLDASGAYEHCSSHDASGVYTFHAVRNALASDIESAWLYLDDPGPVPTYTVHPPQPTSLEIMPSTVRAGSGSYTMTVGNGAGVTLDYRYRLNNAPREESIGTVSLQAVSEGSTTGQATVNTGPCLAVGNYVFTEIRNTLNMPWVSVSGAQLEVTAPPAPVVTQVNPASIRAGSAVDVTLTGSNLCHISLSSSVAGITFSDVIYDEATGATVTARIQLASSTPVGTATITLTASGGSTTFNFQVEQSTAPMVTSVLPMDLTHSSDSITLNGSNLNGVSFEVASQTAISGEDSKRYFPSVSFHSQDPAGTWLKLNVDASNTEILDFYTIVVWNDTDDDGDQDSDEIDEGLFRVIPDGPIVDYWSPSQTDPGKVYVVSLNGKNLQHAELIAVDENRLRVSNVDNSRDNRLTALVKVLSTAASGETDLIVRDSDDREWPVTITVASLSTRSQSLSVSNVTADIEGLAPLYVQQFKARESFTRSLGQARSVFWGFNYAYNLVNFQWQLPMIYCSSLGEYGDFCLKDLQPGQSVDIEGFVISVYVNADLLIYWRGWPPSYPLACLRATAAFEFPGAGGFRESVNFCFGEYVFAGTSGHTASMTIDGGGPCVQVEQFRRREGAIGVVPARVRVTRLGCCDDPDGAVTITASGDTFRSQTFATNFSLDPGARRHGQPAGQLRGYHADDRRQPKPCQHR